MTAVIEDEDFVVVRTDDERLKVVISDTGLPGADGTDGIDGESAYEIAVANGFVGTELDWLSSLVGADGADGAAGPQGPPGTPGAPDLDNVDHITFDTTSTFSPIEGSISWNHDDFTFDLGLGGGVVLQVGQEFFMPKCLNNSGVIIPNGSFVMATGAQGDQITIAKGVNNGTIAPEYMIGVATEDIAIGSNTGRVTTNGIVRGINTGSWPVGTLLYPSPTVPGALTSTKPSAPGSRLPIAIVLRQHVNTGRIYVRMAIGQHLSNDIDDVQITNPQAGDTLSYNSTLGIWQNAAHAGGGNADTLDGFDSTYFLNTSATVQTKAGDLNISGQTTTDSIDLSSAQINSSSFTINLALPLLIDSFFAVTYRSAEYTFQFTQGTSYASVKMMLIHDGTDVSISEYAHVEIGTPIAYEFDATYSLGSLELTIECPSANVTPVGLKFSRVLFDA